MREFAAHMVWVCFVESTDSDAPFLTVNDIDHPRTKVRSPQTYGICQWFHKAVLREFDQVTLREKVYEDLRAVQADLDTWIDYYNTQRTYQAKNLAHLGNPTQCPVVQ